MITLQNLIDKIEKRISEYIEFDVKEIFMYGDYIAIYGGAVRDSIAGLEIHDVDIICMPESASNLALFLKSRNYIPLDLMDRDSFEMYKDISLISDPWTFMNENKKIIQIIRPHYQGLLSKSNYEKAYLDLIKNVDISCCGVFIEPSVDSYIDFNTIVERKRRVIVNDLVRSEKIPSLILKEACKNAIIHCLSKTFEINEWSKLYNLNRIARREFKLTERGWKNLNKELDLWEIDPFPFSSTASIKRNKRNQKNERILKLLNLEFQPEYDYKVWSELEYEKRATEKN